MHLRDWIRDRAFATLTAPRDLDIILIATIRRYPWTVADSCGRWACPDDRKFGPHDSEFAEQGYSFEDQCAIMSDWR